MSRISNNSARWATLLVVASMALCLHAAAQIGSAANLQIMQNGQNARDQRGNTAGGDKAFVKKALQGGLFEVQTSQLALEKSPDAEVRKFARQMVDEHTRMGNEMQTVANQAGVNTRVEMARKDNNMLARLQSLGGDAFDQAYVSMMVKCHEADADAYRSESTSGSIAAVKDAAAKDLPVIETHLQMIQSLAKTVHVDSSAR